MNDVSASPLPVSPYSVPLARTDLRQMLGVARALFRLSNNPAYLAEVTGDAPEIVRFDPGHAAVMMGYDFHLSEQGPRLIEVNTNAGGGFLALQGEDDPQRKEQLMARAIDTFEADFAHYAGATELPLGSLVILDEAPREQFLYPEMRAFAEALELRGVRTRILDPSELQADSQGVFYAGERIDMLYNRHCDFYLATQEMAGIRAAYLAGSVCLSPNPRAYGLLADKRRMLLWQDVSRLQGWGVSRRDIAILHAAVPECRLLADLDRETAWREHRQWVFKPVDQFGSRGVLVGEKATRSRFEQLDPATTLCQRLVEPPRYSYADGKTFKADLRLFAYRDRLLGVTARLYRGQVTNMRTEGGGFARVEVR